MMTTTIELPTELKNKVEMAAHAREMSLDDFVCEALEWMLSQPGNNDPLYADNAVFTGEVPTDISERHDYYLYDERK